MIKQPQLFDTNPGNITDFSGVPVSEVFNQTVVPRVNSILNLFDLSAGLDEAKQRRESRLAQDTETELYQSAQDDNYLASMNRAETQPLLDELGISPLENYNSPIPMDSKQPQAAPSSPPSMDGFDKVSLKLSNYGYDSDSSPDYNSNVAKIGHANNKLVDGVSAALTRSLAKRYGLKTGDYFEAVTADGKILKRRYDDTVPTTYKGRPLPETVDLYEQSGSNKFGGKVVGIRILPKE